MRLKISTLARQDLLDIGDFIAQDNPRRAVSFVRELRAACTGLLENPFRYAALDDTTHRRRVYGQYLIIYRIEADLIFVARIVSAAMDLRGVIDES